jgi:hypothetical protein
MPHIYRDARQLEHQPKVDGGECVRLVQHYTQVGPTSTWRQGPRVLDEAIIEEGTVIANFNKQGRWPGKRKGNHAAFFIGFGPRGPDGKPMWIVVQDQWKAKDDIHMRRIERHGLKLHDEGNRVDDSDNAEHFYIVK